MICDIAISRADVSRRLTKRFNRFCENGTDETTERKEKKRERERGRETRILRRHRVYRGTRAAPCIIATGAKRRHGRAFIRGKSEV